MVRGMEGRGGTKKASREGPEGAMPRSVCMRKRSGLQAPPDA